MDILHKVALYARFSSDQQRQESLDAQIRAMKKYCQDKHYLIVATYTDAAKSATSDKRPSFQKMIADSASGNFDMILVHKLDRFSRNRFDSAYYRRKLKRNGVSLCSVLENLDGTPESIILEGLLESMSEYFSKNLSREVSKGLKENALRCIHNGGYTPLGFAVGKDKRLVIKEDDANIVRMIFDLYDKGFQYSYIMKKLHECGYTTQRGNAFSKSSISDILRNEKYAGVYIYSKLASKDSDNRRNGHKYKPEEQIIRIEGGCPAIISKEQFLRVARRLESNANRHASREGKEHYLLTSKVVCGVCGGHMNGSSRYSGSGKHYQSTYRCPKLRKICGNREINRIYLDNYVNDHMRKHFFTLDNLAKIKTAFDNSLSQRTAMQEQRLTRLTAQKNDTEKQIANLLVLVERGAVNDVIVSKINSLTEQKNDLESSIASFTRFNDNDIDWAPEEVMSEFQNLSFGTDEYRVFLQRFIKEVRIYPYEIEIIFKAGEFNDFTEIPLELSTILNVRISRKNLYSMFDSRVTKADRSKMTGA